MHPQLITPTVNVTPIAERSLAMECNRLMDRLKLIFHPDEMCTYADFRSDELKMSVMIVGHSLTSARQRLDRAGVHIYSETPMLNDARHVAEIILELVSYSVLIKLACLPEEIAEAA